MTSVFRTAAFVVITSGWCGVCFAQQRLPTDVELRASYCIRVVKWNIDFINQHVGELDTQLSSLGGGDSVVVKRPNGSTATERQKREELLDQIRVSRHTLADLQNTLSRLKLYLGPRLGYLEPTGIVNASQRADADLQQYVNEASECSNRCEQKKEPFSTCVVSCVNSDESLSTRMRACSNPAWLPF